MTTEIRRLPDGNWRVNQGELHVSVIGQPGYIRYDAGTILNLPTSPPTEVVGAIRESLPNLGLTIDAEGKAHAQRGGATYDVPRSSVPVEQLRELLERKDRDGVPWPSVAQELLRQLPAVLDELESLRSQLSALVAHAAAVATVKRDELAHARTRLAQARRWIANCVDPVEVGETVKEAMLDLLDPEKYSTRLIHECPKNGCDRQVRSSQLACYDHWQDVPRALRAELGRRYRIDPFTPEYFAAREACVDAMNGVGR